MLILRNSVAWLLLVLSIPVLISAQTVRQWQQLSKSDSTAAATMVIKAFEAAQTKSVLHYQQRGDVRRARIVEKINPNVDELVGRLAFVARAQPDAQVEDVMRGYLVDTSADLLKKQDK